jgi:hypothetical protein
MSFIYAYNDKNKITILSDTKVSIDDDDKLRLEKQLTKEECSNITNFGMVKTVIYKSDITVSSAGELKDFNELLGLLFEKNINNIEDILNEGLNINKKYKGQTDFIITTTDKIYEIKNGEIAEQNTAWIGDVQAFSKFQKELHSMDTPKITVVNNGEATEELYPIGKISEAFTKVVNDTSIKTVDGLVVTCTFEKEYYFLGKYRVYTGFNYQQTLFPGEKVIFTNEVEDGGLSYYIPDCKKYYTVLINQTNKSLVFRPGYSNKDYKYLSLATWVPRDNIHIE